MARLILSLDGQVLAEYNMDKERFLIGRLPDNDVRIDHTAVSGHHSLIVNILNDSFLEDRGSTNGTYVNGKLIKKHALQNSDVITVGRHQLRFVDDQNAASQEEFEKTMVITPGSEVAATAAKRVAEATPAAAKPTPTTGTATAMPGANKAAPEGTAMALSKARLQVLNGAFAGRELELNKALTTLGRPGIQVAAISRRSDGFFIIHVDSGKENDFPLINGTAIGQQAHKLTNNDVIQLAGIKLGFFEN